MNTYGAASPAPPRRHPWWSRSAAVVAATLAIGMLFAVKPASGVRIILAPLRHVRRWTLDLSPLRFTWSLARDGVEPARAVLPAPQLAAGEHGRLPLPSPSAAHG
ncbi:hypothetical protein [Streptomyces sp. NPDC029003]|uniref:hypothetical protein n=1 Tax=Streptomyces sp. NPDC029003 TaxID=3155125 RepID=UPI0033F304C7